MNKDDYIILQTRQSISTYSRLDVKPDYFSLCNNNKYNLKRCQANNSEHTFSICCFRIFIPYGIYEIQIVCSTLMNEELQIS